MIQKEEIQKEFSKYANRYEVTNPNIQRKIGHSIRVMNINENLAKKLGLEQEKIELATLIGLLHDIARFEQYTQYQTYNDLASRNHGEWGVEILEENQYIRNYIRTDKYDEIIKKAIRNHNGYKLEENLSEEEKVFCKMIKDADKLDILHEAVTMFWKDKEIEIQQQKPAKEVIEQFEKKQLIENRYKKNQIDYLIGTISFIYDIEFKESLELIKKEDYINKIMDRFCFENETKEQMKKIREQANEDIRIKTE